MPFYQANNAIHEWEGSHANPILGLAVNGVTAYAAAAEASQREQAQETMHAQIAAAMNSQSIARLSLIGQVQQDLNNAQTTLVNPQTQAVGLTLLAQAQAVLAQLAQMG